MTHQRANSVEGSRHMFVQYPELLPTIIQINKQIEKYAITFRPLNFQPLLQFVSHRLEPSLCQQTYYLEVCLHLAVSFGVFVLECSSLFFQVVVVVVDL